MLKIYVCSPYKGNVKENIRKAQKYSKEIYQMGYVPICVHLYLEKATGLNEKNGDRKELLQLGKEFVKWCDEVWVYGKEISNGMKGEIEYARRYKIKVRYVK